MPHSPANVSSPRRAPAVLGGPPAFSEPIYVTKALVPDRAIFDHQVASIFQSQWFTNHGRIVKELERRLEDRLGVGFCAAFCNGTMALQAALRCLDLAGEVITTPFTFPATVHAIRWNGLTPVFCDIDPESYNLDPGRVADALSPRTRALLPVHVFGNPCDVQGFERLAATHDLRIVYDAAHAFDVRHRGRPIGTWGDLSVFSFHATKIFHTAEGGAVVGSDPESRKRLALLRNFGIVNENETRGVGVNGKLSEVHAALGLALLDASREEIDRRSLLAARYRGRLSELEGLGFQRFAPDTVRNEAYCTIEIDETAFGLSRDEVNFALRRENVVARRYFWPLCSENECYRDLPSARPDRLPNARRVASRVLCLPLHGGLSADDVDVIVDCLVTLRSAAPRVRSAIKGHV